MAKKAAKKKIVRKKVSKKKIVSKKKVVRKKVSITPERTRQLTSQYNSRFALRDLILFALLSVISFMLFTVSGSELYQDMFYLLAMIFGFVAVAFLIAYLALIFSRVKVKRRK